MQRQGAHSFSGKSTKKQICNSYELHWQAISSDEHQASMYEFWYRCYFQNPGLHIDHWRSSIFYESKIYNLSIWTKKPTTVHSKRKSHGIRPTLCRLCAGMVLIMMCDRNHVLSIVSKGELWSPVQVTEVMLILVCICFAEVQVTAGG